MLRCFGGVGVVYWLLFWIGLRLINCLDLVMVVDLLSVVGCCFVFGFLLVYFVWCGGYCVLYLLLWSSCGLAITRC